MPTDKIVRWGIPGWILMTWIVGILFILNFEEAISFLTNEALKSLSLTAVFASIGVPVGYIIHELYFSFSWSFRKLKLTDITEKIENFPKPLNWESLDDKEKYYYIEFLWDKCLNELENEGYRDFLKVRYRDRLTLIHSLGTLFTSIILATIFTIVICLSSQISLIYVLIVTLLQSLFAFTIIQNYRYHSKQLKSYQGYYLNDLLNKEAKI